MLLSAPNPHKKTTQWEPPLLPPSMPDLPQELLPEQSLHHFPLMTTMTMRRRRKAAGTMITLQGKQMRKWRSASLRSVAGESLLLSLGSHMFSTTIIKTQKRSRQPGVSFHPQVAPDSGATPKLFQSRIRKQYTPYRPSPLRFHLATQDDSSDDSRSSINHLNQSYSKSSSPLATPSFSLSSNSPSPVKTRPSSKPHDVSFTLADLGEPKVRKKLFFLLFLFLFLMAGLFD